MDVISVAKGPLELEEPLVEERGVEADATALRRTDRTLEVHLLTSIKKTRHHSRSSTTGLVVREELEPVLALSEDAVLTVVPVVAPSMGCVQGLLVEVATLHAAAGLEDEATGAGGGTGKR
jgi:hypothetical protein